MCQYEQYYSLWFNKVAGHTEGFLPTDLRIQRNKKIFTCVQQGCDRLLDQDVKLKVSSGGLLPLRTLSPLPDASSRPLLGSDCALVLAAPGPE